MCSAKKRCNANLYISYRLAHDESGIVNLGCILTSIMWCDFHSFVKPLVKMWSVELSFWSWCECYTDAVFIVLGMKLKTELEIRITGKILSEFSDLELSLEFARLFFSATCFYRSFASPTLYHCNAAGRDVADRHRRMQWLELHTWTWANLICTNKTYLYERFCWFV